jgi:hypothetical protein
MAPGRTLQYEFAMNGTMLTLVQKPVGPVLKFIRVEYLAMGKRATASWCRIRRRSTVSENRDQKSVTGESYPSRGY